MLEADRCVAPLRKGFLFQVGGKDDSSDKTLEWGLWAACHKLLGGSSGMLCDGMDPFVPGTGVVSMAPRADSELIPTLLES